jgi:hypothetical protein
MTELRIGCVLRPIDLQQRRAELLPGLVTRAVERLPVPNGYRWRFAPATISLFALMTVIAAERSCCRFLRFVVTAEPDDGPISLEVTGPPGTQEFLDGLVGGVSA